MAGAPQSGSFLGGLGSDLGSFLSHPLVQSALASYFGAISTPRYMGRGAALGRGGLAGLQTLGQAEQRQAMLPKLQAESKLDIAKAQQAIQQAQAQKALLNWIDTDPAAQKMDPQQRMIFRLAVTSGHIPPGFDPYHQGLLGIAKQKEQLAEKGEKAKEHQLQALESTYGPLTAERQAQAERAQAGIGAEQAAAAKSRAEAGAVPARIAAEEAAAAKSTAEAGLVPERKKYLEATIAALPGKAAAGQINKVNTDLGRFLTSNPAGTFSNHEELVNRAVNYAAKLNPGVDPSAIRDAADSLIPATGMGAKVMSGLGMGPSTSPVAPPPGATHEILGPDGTVAGHRGKDGKIIWLPGKEPRTSAER
jgi:hypothetical protein